MVQILSFVSFQAVIISWLQTIAIRLAMPPGHLDPFCYIHRCVYVQTIQFATSGLINHVVDTAQVKWKQTGCTWAPLQPGVYPAVKWLLLFLLSLVRTCDWLGCISVFYFSSLWCAALINYTEESVTSIRLLMTLNINVATIWEY